MDSNSPSPSTSIDLGSSSPEQSKKFSTNPRYPKQTSGKKLVQAPTARDDELSHYEVASHLLYECYLEVTCESLASGKKVKDKEWKTMTCILEGQQITLYDVDKKKPVLTT